MITSETSTIHAVAKSWAEQFPQQQDTILHDNTQAPLLAQHGSTELQQLWDIVLNKEYLVQASDAIVMNNVCVCVHAISDVLHVLNVLSSCL